VKEPAGWTPRAHYHLVPSPGALKRPTVLTGVQASDRVPLRSKYRPLLEDDRIRKWVDYVARGSAITAEVYLRRLGRVCEEMGIPPSELLNKDEESIWNFLNDLISDMEIKKSWRVHTINTEGH
jgi:hypothetical protein